MSKSEDIGKCILFSVIIICSVVLAIFLVWFTKSLFGLAGLLFMFACYFFDGEKPEKETTTETETA